MFAADVRRANEVVEELEVGQVKTCYVSKLQWTTRLRNHADNQRFLDDVEKQLYSGPWREPQLPRTLLVGLEMQPVVLRAQRLHPTLETCKQLHVLGGIW